MKTKFFFLIIICLSFCFSAEMISYMALSNSAGSSNTIITNSAQSTATASFLAAPGRKYQEIIRHGGNLAEYKALAADGLSYKAYIMQLKGKSHTPGDLYFRGRALHFISIPLHTLGVAWGLPSIIKGFRSHHPYDRPAYLVPGFSILSTFLFTGMILNAVGSKKIRNSRSLSAGLIRKCYQASGTIVTYTALRIDFYF